MAYINTGAYDKWRKQKEEQEALANYNAQKENLDNKYSGGGLGGFLGNIVGGIGKTIGDTGYAIGGLFGTAGASLKDLIEGKAGTAENTKAFKRTYYGAEDDKDAAAKAAGNALNAATNIATAVVPVAGAGGTAAKVLGGTAANTIGGAIGGVADELAQQGKDFNLESATNRALSGAAGGFVGGKVGSKLGNASSKLGSTLLNNKLATSTLGRGAIAGAAGGATGAGTSAALSGGDIMQAAIEGGLSGAATGATQAGVMAGANKLAQNAKNKLGINKQTATANVVADNTTNTKSNDLDIPDYTTPKGWDGKEIKLSKKGTIGGIGDKLVNASKSIKDQDVYNSLYSKTADRIIENNSIERLRAIGFEPKDYGDAATVSTAVNKFFDDVVAGSKATYTDPDFVNRVSRISDDVILGTDAVKKKYDTEVNALISRLERGSAPGEYDVKTLLDESRNFSKKAATEYKNGIDVNGGDKGNYRKDLGEAFSKISKDLRSMADAGMDNLGEGNYTKQQLRTMLENLKAPKASIEYLTDFKSLPEAIRKTSLLEDGRQMAKELAKTKIRRNANAGGEGKFLNRVANKSGFSEVTNLVAEPIGKVAGTGLEAVGKGLQNVDNFISGATTTGTATRVSTQPMSQNTQVILGNLIARTEAQRQAGDNMQNLRSQQEYSNLEDQLANSMADISAKYDSKIQAAQAQATNPAQAQLADIANGMNLALAAGDIDSYNKLASLYQTAYKMYELQNPTTEAEGSNLSTAEKNQIAKLQSAGTALDQLETLYKKAGGGQGIVGGNIANFLGGLGLNSDVNTYNQLAQGLINQIGAAIGKTDSLNTEGEVQRALSLVPKITDDNQTAQNKIATLRQLLQQNTGTYNQLYGA